MTATANGTYPLNAMILGGRQVHAGDDYIVSLLTPKQVRDVAAAAYPLTRETLAAGYARIDVEDYGPHYGDEDFTYTWSNFGDLKIFFHRSADDEQHVIFTVGQ